MGNRRGRRRVGQVVVVVAALTTLWIAAASIAVSRGAEGRTFSAATEIPRRDVGVVLGCSRVLTDGRANAYFENRIAAAVQLFQAGKVKYLVVSGDHHTIDYDEPQDMKNSLVNAGVPADRIYCDYAGFRTLDSVMRLREIFDQTKVTIISQKFHNQRAIFIAEHRGIDAIGFNAPDVDAYNVLKTRCRELIARANMLVDLFVIRRQPKFLGVKITIPD